MRRFTSYGPPNPKLHYYAPRQALVDYACAQLLGDVPSEGGHYITIWAPRQSGKTWVMQQVVERLQVTDEYEVAILSLQSAKEATSAEAIFKLLTQSLQQWFERDFPEITQWIELPNLFSRPYFEKPLLLILDEFDALGESFINKFVNEFRSIYLQRQNEANKPSREKVFLLHGLALIGVRGVLGIENVKGSPFNVQRSLHIPNLTHDEVAGMFHWYEEESGQKVEPAVIDRLFYETQGQPGIVGWLGELLTETYNKHQPVITQTDFEDAYSAAINLLPNNNILNIISKAKEEPYKAVVLELFKTDKKQRFAYDDPLINYLYTNGVVDQERVAIDEYYLKFPSPFVQKRLFNYFARTLFPELGRLYDPFDNLDDTITETDINIRRLLQRYEEYLQQNRTRLLADAPRRKIDLRIYEAVFHFNFFLFLARFLESYDAKIYPEFPTGNGKIDLLIKHAGRLYGLEVKSFANQRQYRLALQQAADYAQQLQLQEITLVLFVEQVNDERRHQYEVVYTDASNGITVSPIFVMTGEG